MAEKTPTQQLAEKLLYKPAYVTDKDADVKQKAHEKLKTWFDEEELKAADDLFTNNPMDNPV